jgi:peptidyl-prolyl cis-trans isomerase A (cyclophilin A)
MHAGMKNWLPLVLVLSGCPKKPIEGEEALSPLRLPGQQAGPILCVSPVSAAGKMDVADRVVWTEAASALESRDVARAAVVVAQGGTHAGLAAMRGVTSLLSGNHDAADAFYQSVLAQAPDDACALMAGALVAAQVGNLDVARSRAERAWELAPDDPEAGFLLALIIGRVEPDAFERYLEAVVARHPDHGKTHLALASAAEERGELDAVVRHLEDAGRAGFPVDDALRAAYLAAGRLGDVLRIASRNREPLGDDGRLATAEDPERDYYAMLGGEPGDAVWADIETSMGTLSCELFPTHAPVTVGNFAGLASGRIEWVDPTTGAHRRDPLYNNVLFHRVIPEFMIQGGDPAGNGTGGPGYRFGDEVSTGLAFDRPGRLAMANAGPGTNGSQWFITEGTPSHLTGRHTIFGQCTDETVERVKAIARVDRDSGDRPVVPVIIREVTIRAVSGAASESLPPR